MPLVSASSPKESRFVEIDRLGIHHHACLVYSTTSEQLNIVIPFILTGLQRRERCLYIADESSTDTVIEALQAAGINTEEHLRTGALLVISKFESYLRLGYFDPRLMIEFLQEILRETKEKGFTALRATAEMTWALGNEYGVERVLEYEAKLNYFFPQHNILAICQYNRTRFSSETIKGVIQTHPLVINSGLVNENRFWVPPEEYLNSPNPESEVERMLKQIEAATRQNQILMERERQLATLISNIPGIVYRSRNDALRTMEFMSAETRNLTGFAPEDFVNNQKITYSSLIHPEDQEQVSQAIQKALATQESYILDYRLITASGETRHFSEKGRGVINEHGDIQALEGLIVDVTLHRQAEEKHRQLSAIVESCDEAIVGKSLEGIITSWNQGAEHIYGYSANDVLGKSISILSAKNEMDEFDEALKHIAAGEIIRNYEAVRRRKDGLQIIMLITLSPIRNSNGTIVGMSTVGHDVTERRKIEIRLRESEELHRTFVENSNDLIWMLNTEGNFVFVNRRCAEFADSKTENLIGKSFIPFVVENEIAAITQRFHQILQGERHQFEVHVKRSDGAIHLLSVNSTAVHKDNKIIGAMSFGLDITQQRKAEDDRRISEERFRLVALASNDGIWDYDLINNFMWWNDRYDQILGPRPKDSHFDILWWSDRIHPDDRCRVMACLEKSLNGKEDHTTCQYRFIRPDGRVVSLCDRAYIVRNPKGEALRILGTVLDMTPYVEAQEQLQKLSAKLVNQQEEERRRIARELHDSTAQKLTGLILTLGQLEKVQGLARARHLIQECCSAAKDSMNEIRNLSYLLHPPLLEELGLEVSLDTYLRGFSKRSGITVSLDFQNEARELPQDVALALFRIVQESLGNIHRHSNSLTASVQVARLNNRIILEILDQGCGIPKHTLTNLKARRLSSGIGILGMHERLEQIGGILEIESSSQGTLIRAIVPFAVVP